MPLLYTVLLYRSRAHINPPLPGDRLRQSAPRSAAITPFEDRQACLDDLHTVAEQQAWKRTERERFDDIKRLEFLFEHFEPRCYLFEVFECVRKLMLTGVLIFIYPGTPTQLFFGFVVALVSMKVYAFYQPWVLDNDDTLSEVAQWQIIFLLLCSLMAFAAAGCGALCDDEGAYTSNAFGALMVAVSSTAGLLGVYLMAREGDGVQGAMEGELGALFDKLVAEATATIGELDLGDLLPAGASRFARLPFGPNEFAAVATAIGGAVPALVGELKAKLAGAIDAAIRAAAAAYCDTLANAVVPSASGTTDGATAADNAATAARSAALRAAAEHLGVEPVDALESATTEAKDAAIRRARLTTEMAEVARLTTEMAEVAQAEIVAVAVAAARALGERDVVPELRPKLGDVPDKYAAPMLDVVLSSLGHAAGVAVDALIDALVAASTSAADGEPPTVRAVMDAVDTERIAGETTTFARSELFQLGRKLATAAVGADMTDAFVAVMEGVEDGVRRHGGVSGGQEPAAAVAEAPATAAALADNGDDGGAAEGVAPHDLADTDKQRGI